VAAGWSANAAAPVISVQPLAQQATVGGAVEFSVLATGAGNLTYAWTKNGTNLASATTARLFLAPVTALDAGDYRVNVTNADGTTTSAAAALVVNLATTISSSLTSSFPTVGPVASRLTLAVELNYANEALPTSR
jgi:hypothetical protein